MPKSTAGFIMRPGAQRKTRETADKLLSRGACLVVDEWENHLHYEEKRAQQRSWYREHQAQNVRGLITHKTLVTGAVESFMPTKLNKAVALFDISKSSVTHLKLSIITLINKRLGLSTFNFSFVAC